MIAVLDVQDRTFINEAAKRRIFAFIAHIADAVVTGRSILPARRVSSEPSQDSGI